MFVNSALCFIPWDYYDLQEFRVKGKAKRLFVYATNPKNMNEEVNVFWTLDSNLRGIKSVPQQTGCFIYGFPIRNVFGTVYSCHRTNIQNTGTIGAANSCEKAAAFSSLGGRAGIGLKTGIKDMDQGGPTRCIIGILCRQPT